MLVLSRKSGQSIKIGDTITVVIHRISGNRVTIGLEAPRDMRIIRGELKPFEEADDDAEDGGPLSHSNRGSPISIPIEPESSDQITRLRHRVH